MLFIDMPIGLSS